VGAEELFVFVHQQALPDRGAGLPHHHVVEAVAMQAEAPASEANGSGGHEDDLPTLLFQEGDGLGDRAELADVELPVAARHDARAQFDHGAARCAQPLLLFAFQALIP